MIKLSYIDQQFIAHVLREDIGRGDLTTQLTVDENEKGSAVIMAKEELVLCGIELITYIYQQIDPEIKVSFSRQDGEKLIQSDIVAVVEGSLVSLLTGERTVLNFLQRLSGIASKSAEYTSHIAQNSKTTIVDTRKTTPGWRLLEKYAVKTGGCGNHRFGLDDGIMIKDNHIVSAGSITKAVDKARKGVHHLLKIEVETKNLAEVQEALDAGADVIMLDNMDTLTIEKALKEIDNSAVVEVSGGITEQRIKELSILNVDYISVGALTHSAISKDINMTLERN